MFLQATVDAADEKSARDLLRVYSEVDEIDRIEIGAPMITHYGVDTVDFFKWRTRKPLYADLKMIDFPIMESAPYLEKGIRLISAMAVMNDWAFQKFAPIAKRLGVQVCISMMGYPKRLLRDRVHDLLHHGYEYFIAHGAGVTRGQAFDDLQQQCFQIHDIRGIKLVVAGGIGPDNAGQLRAYAPEGVIVGRGLADAPDPRIAAQTIKQALS